MLSRIAESLYWIGRYVERAEDTARILDVHYHLLLEDPGVDEEAACRALLEVMGVAHRADGMRLDADSVTEMLAYDPTYAGSIVGRRAPPPGRTPAGRGRPCRAEMWECLNATYIALPEAREVADGSAPTPFFAGSRSAPPSWPAWPTPR